MTPYKQHRPTAFDRAGAFLDEDRQGWLVAPVTRTRDSGPREESNFHTFLEGLGGEGDNVEVHRFGHWGPGWYEIIIINPGAEDIVAKAEEMESSLENYPVLDDEDLSEREHKAEVESWNSWARRGFADALRNRVAECWNDATEHGFTYDDIDDGFDLFTSDDIDAFWHDGAKDANWSVQHESDGPRFNIDAVVGYVSIDEVIEKMDSLLWKQRVNADIRKLCQRMNVPQHIADLAVSMQCTLVSQIRKLQLTTK